MRELPRFPGKLRVAKALLGNLEGPGTEEALCPPSQVECHLVKLFYPRSRNPGATLTNPTLAEAKRLGGV